MTPGFQMSNTGRCFLLGVASGEDFGLGARRGSWPQALPFHRGCLNCNFTEANKVNEWGMVRGRHQRSKVGRSQEIYRRQQGVCKVKNPFLNLNPSSRDTFGGIDCPGVNVRFANVPAIRIKYF